MYEDQIYIFGLQDLDLILFSVVKIADILSKIQFLYYSHLVSL